MAKLWQKDKNWKLNSFIETFETKGDLVLDQKLVKYDVWGTMAHAKGLYKLGIISKKELKSLKLGLNKIIELDVKGKFILSSGDEDIHTKIENYLTEGYGDVGKKVHTGRSRNDQVLSVIRLYTRDHLFNIWQKLIDLVITFVYFAQKYEFVVMPGLTHMQKAMPSSVGMWAGSYVEALLDDLEVFKSIYKLNNQSPLGSAAAYGVPLPLRREYTAGLLGFDKVQNNSLYCQNSRGKIEGAVVAALITILQDINKLASDIMLFTTAEFNYFNVSNSLCSGSSIMPQKRNIDIAELLRSKVHIMLGNYAQIVSLSANLPSGYNRDLQDSKKPFFESLEMVGDCLQVSDIVIKNIEPNEENMLKDMTPEIFATHKALELVKKGQTFREAYKSSSTREIFFGDAKRPTSLSESLPPKQNLDSRLNTRQTFSTPQKTHATRMLLLLRIILKQSTHIGGTGNLGLDVLKKKIEEEKKGFEILKKKHEKAINKLMK